MIIGYSVLSRLFSGVSLTSSFGGFNLLGSGGIPARGILLRVSSTRVGTTSINGVRYERRQVLIDVEVPGKPPYEVSGTPYYPANLAADILPGATVELRVDPKDPNNIAIYGPGVGLAAAPFALAAPAAPQSLPASTTKRSA